MWKIRLSFWKFGCDRMRNDSFLWLMIEKWIEVCSMICVENFSKTISRFENNLQGKVESFSKIILKFERVINR